MPCSSTSSDPPPPPVQVMATSRAVACATRHQTSTCRVRHSQRGKGATRRPEAPEQGDWGISHVVQQVLLAAAALILAPRPP